MNLKEFAALKVGDKIENSMLNSTYGVITEVTKAGVKLRWNGGGPEFAYPVNSTAWFHWSKVDEPEKGSTDA